jgi:hypothetical protein
MSNQALTSPTYTLGGVLRAPLVNNKGNASWALTKWMQSVEQRTALALTLLGQIASSTVVQGRTEGIGTTLQNISSTGTGSLDNFVTDGPVTYSRVLGSALTSHQVDLSQAGVINKTLTYVADDPSGGRNAWSTTTQKNAAVTGSGNLLLKNINNAAGSTSSPTTTSTTYVQVPDLTQTITTKGNPVYICFSCAFNDSQSAATALFAIFVDGSQVSPNFYGASPTGGQNMNVSGLWIASGLSAASHIFAVYWKTSVNTNTITANGVDRAIQVVELG